MTSIKKQGFTLIELLIVIAILGILAAIVMIAIDPTEKMRQARDAGRKYAIAQIVSGLQSYFVAHGSYPLENVCDSSKGMKIVQPNCKYNSESTSDDPPNGSDWEKADSSSKIYKLVTEGHLKILPTDPINNDDYFYRYEPNWTSPFGDAPSWCSSYGTYGGNSL